MHHFGYVFITIIFQKAHKNNSISTTFPIIFNILKVAPCAILYIRSGEEAKLKMTKIPYTPFYAFKVYIIHLSNIVF